MKKILVIGLGVMTSGIIKNLKKKEEFEIFLLSRHCRSIQGVTLINNFEQISEIRNLDIILTCFTTGEESVEFAEKIKEAVQLNYNLWLIDMTTSKPSLVKKAKRIFESPQTHYVECPVTGSKQGSMSGSLSLFLHINDRVVVPDYINLLFDCVAEHKYYFEKETEPTRFKLLYNAWGAAILNSIKTYNPSRLGLCPSSLETANHIIKNDGWMRLVCSSKLDQINSGDFDQVSFNLKYMKKDLSYAREEIFGDFNSNFNFLYDQIKNLEPNDNQVDFSIIGR